MTRFHLGLLAGAVVCALVAWNLEQRVAAGLALGFLLGTSVSVIGLKVQQRALHARSPGALSAIVGALLAKLVLILTGAIVLRYVGVLREHIDWTSYLLAFPCAVLWTSALGSLDTLRLLKQARPA